MSEREWASEAEEAQHGDPRQTDLVSKDLFPQLLLLFCNGNKNNNKNHLVGVLSIREKSMGTGWHAADTQRRPLAPVPLAIFNFQMPQIQ